MFCMAVFETDRQRQEILHDCLTRYIFERNTDLDIFWFTGQDAVQKLGNYAAALCLAFVSLEESGGLQFGLQLYRQNPDCRIYYYKTTPCDLNPLLASRPAGFYLWPPVQADFAAMMDALVLEIEQAADFFCFTSRQEIYHLPVSSITYFESDLKHVLVHRQTGEAVRLPAKLSEIESRLGMGFVRIHKSYIVNKACVRMLDKKAHICQLESGERLPISEAQYGKAVSRFT